jgi:hypothetical protein
MRWCRRRQRLDNPLGVTLPPQIRSIDKVVWLIHNESTWQVVCLYNTY